MSLFKRIATVALVGLSALSAMAQIAPGRTWPELKDAVTERAKAQRYPLNGFDPAEVQQILSRIG
jgi:esterase FrsA